MSRLTRLSARAYGRLTPGQRQAVDRLEWSTLDAAGRGEAKTVLGWRRTREETIAYARELLDAGLMPKAVADRLRVSDDYLRRLLEAGPTDVDRVAYSGPALIKRWLRDGRQLMEQYPELFVDAVNRVEADAERHFVLDRQEPPRNRSIHAADSGLTDRGKVIGRP